MAIALRVSSTLAATGTTATSGALTGTQSGDLITVVLRERDGGTPTGVSDSVNGAWDLTNNLAVARGAGVGDHIRIYYFWNSGAGNPTVTVDYGGSVVFNAYVDCWSGAQTTSAVLDQTNSTTNGSGTSHSHGSITMTATGLALTGTAYSGEDGGVTPATDFTVADTLDKSSRQYRITTAITTTATETSANSTGSNGAIASFKEASGGSTAVPVFVHHLRMQGIS